MKCMATKTTKATTTTNPISSVVTRAGSDTGYHLVSVARLAANPLHTVATSIALVCARGCLEPAGSFRQEEPAGTMPSYDPDRDGGTNSGATSRRLNDKIVIHPVSWRWGPGFAAARGWPAGRGGSSAAGHGPWRVPAAPWRDWLPRLPARAMSQAA